MNPLSPKRIALVLLGMTLGMTCATQANAAQIARLHIQDGNLYMATDFTTTFALERRVPGQDWERVTVFTDLNPYGMEWLRAVRLDGTPNPLDSTILFTPGDLQGTDGSKLPAVAGTWTLIRKGLGGAASAYGPMLRQESAIAQPEPVDAIMDDSTALLFWQSTAGELAFWGLNTNGVRNTNGLVSTNVLLPPASHGPWVLGGAGDINGDGRPELFWCRTNQIMQTWFLDANNQFRSEATLYGSYCPAEYQLRAIGTGSIGNSTNPTLHDLFFQDIYFGYIDTWHLNLDGTLHVAVPTYASSINRSQQLRACGDVDGDGRVELFFHNTNNFTSQTWFLDIDGKMTASNVMYGAVAAGWNMRCAGDATGDGLAEVFWQHTNGATCVWFLNTNGYATSSRRIYTKNIATGWNMKAATDVDGDRRVELIWQHTNGATCAWFLNTNGTLKTSRKIISGNVASKWNIQSVAPVSAVF